MTEEELDPLSNSILKGRGKVTLENQKTKQRAVYVSRNYKQPDNMADVDVIFTLTNEKVPLTQEGQKEEAPSKTVSSSSSDEESELSLSQQSEEETELSLSQLSEENQLERETRGRSLVQEVLRERKQKVISWSPRPWDMSDMGRAIARSPERSAQQALQVTDFAADIIIPGYDALKGYATGEYSASQSLVLAGLDLIPGKKIIHGVAKGTKKVGKALFKAEHSAINKLGALDKNITQLNQPLLRLEAPKMVKHHIFNKFRGTSQKSQKYRNFFKHHNIDVDSFTIEIPGTMHVNKIHMATDNWTTKWKKWIDAHPNANTKQVYQFAGKLMDEYGINHLPLTHYKKK